MIGSVIFVQWYFHHVHMLMVVIFLHQKQTQHLLVYRNSLALSLCRQEVPVRRYITNYICVFYELVALKVFWTCVSSAAWWFTCYSRPGENQKITLFVFELFLTCFSEGVRDLESQRMCFAAVSLMRQKVTSSDFLVYTVFRFKGIVKKLLPPAVFKLGSNPVNGIDELGSRLLHPKNLHQKSHGLRLF